MLRLLELKGAVVTIDAMGTQKDIAAQITAPVGDYLLALKGNHTLLHADTQELFADEAALQEQKARASRDEFVCVPWSGDGTVVARDVSLGVTDDAPDVSPAGAAEERERGFVKNFTSAVGQRGANLLHHSENRHNTPLPQPLMETATAPAPATPVTEPAAAPVVHAKHEAPEPFTALRGRKPRVVVIGGGFGGLEAVKQLRGEDMDITLVDRSNHHLFQPLLYQVATAGLTPANIARPLREIFHKQKNVEVIMSEAKRIDVEARKVITEDLVLDYDYLIMATGARHSYFGHDEWEKLAPGLKNLSDAVEIRKRMLVAFEIAEKAIDPAEREAAMTFIIVGGGPTGVEMAGAISEIARHTMTRDFRRIKSQQAKVIIIEGAPRILAGFTEDLSASARKQLNEIGVEVHENMVVTNITPEGVEVKGGQFIRARTVVWAAGNAASPLGKTLGVPLDKQGRVIVNDDLTIPGHPEVQVVGDTANFSHQTGRPLPGVSPAAMQEGRHAANNIREMVAGGQPMKFEYWDKGSLATIGRNKAVADLHIIRFGGFFAWLAWAVIHVAFLVGFRNRLAVLSEWLYNYVTFYRGSRLITGMQDGQDSLRHPAPGCEPDPSVSAISVAPGVSKA